VTLAATLLALLSLSCLQGTTSSFRGVAGGGQRSVAGVSNTSAKSSEIAATPTTATTFVSTPEPTIAPTPTPTIDLQKVKPNELGNVPIWEYHIISPEEESQWSITPEHFRQNLQKLYNAGYRPISLHDLLDGHIDLPAGTSPIVLSFDDSSPGQFRFQEKGGELVVDPDSAVGILEAFHAAHPDFAAKAIFNVLPEAEQPHKLFGQPEYEAEKLRYLVEHGFDIGNHTWWHQRLDTVDAQEVQRQLAFAVRSIQQAVPGYQVRSFALPLGLWPEDKSLVFEGSYEGATYHHDAVLLVGSDPAPSPFNKEYDPHALPRVQVFADSLERWLDYLDQNPDERYVSDGDPNIVTFPQRLDSQLNQAALKGKTPRPY
jgi:peptidoglycan/xylan/chitin deacetylase (PgdA/CDA1 family)